MARQIQLLPLTQLHPDGRSSNCMEPDRFRKLMTSIKDQGCIQPLVVRPHPKKKDHYILVDGHYRQQALQELGETSAPCEVWKLDEAQAGLLLASLNRLRGEDHPRKRALLIQGLLPHYSKDVLATLLPESKAQLTDLLALLEQDEADLKESLTRHIEAERASLPETMTFVLTHEEVSLVKATLALRDEANRNRALVLLCQEVTHDDPSNQG